MKNQILSLARLLLVAALMLLIGADVQAQDLHPSRRPSPVGIAKTHLGDTYVKITYSRPYLRGRKVFGANNDSTNFLVPYGELWRTGANEATEITLTGPVEMAGQSLAAGTYSIFTEPGPSSWVVHVSPQLGLDGTGIFNAETQVFTPMYDPAKDVLTFTVPAGSVDGDPVDQFTIEFEDDMSGGAHLVLRWEMTEVRIPLAPTS